MRGGRRKEREVPQRGLLGIIYIVESSGEAETITQYVFKDEVFYHPC